MSPPLPGFHQDHGLTLLPLKPENGTGRRRAGGEFPTDQARQTCNCPGELDAFVTSRPLKPPPPLFTPSRPRLSKSRRRSIIDAR